MTNENRNLDQACMMNSMDDKISCFAADILETLGFGVVIVDAETHRIVYANSKIFDMSGYPRGSVIGNICQGVLCPAEEGNCPITDLGQSVDNSERSMVRVDGTRSSIIKTAVPISMDGKKYLVESLIDNSERKKIQSALTEANDNLELEIVKREQIQNRIEHLAYHDHLTGLANRLLFTNQLNHAVSLAARMSKIFAILFMNLDGFKTINDTMGHARGDQLLMDVAQRLVNTLRKSDVVARFGGDEFIIMIENQDHLESIKVVAEKILNSFNQPFKINNHDLFITTSIGVAVYPADGEDAETLIKNADIAMYKAKEKGRNQCFFCTPVMKTDVIERMKLSNQLYGAIGRNELELYYQPQVQCHSNQIIGLEALLRWRHPEFGMVSPGRFIPIAEQTGLIIPIGEWVMRTACRQNKIWQEAGFPKMRMAVNLSVRQFQHRGIVTVVEDILKETGLEPQYLELEITESIVMKETRHVIDTLQAFKDKGIAISIDDFGTEYSSLNYLKQLPVDKIKIAMPFVQGISISDKDEAITKAIIVLAKSLGLGVIAEGVETETQCSFLTQRMCDEIQGFYYYKPMPAYELEGLLRSMGLSI